MQQNIDVLRARLDEIETEFRSIDTQAGERALDEAEQVRWGRTRRRTQTAPPGVVRRRGRAGARRPRWRVPAPSGAAFRSRRTAWTRSPTSTSSTAADDDPALIDRALTAVEKTEYRRMSYAVSDEARENATRMIEKVPGVAPHGDGDWFAGYMSAFRSWLKGLGAPVYTAEEAQAVRASMSLTSANGGYALPFLLDPTLIHTGAATKNPIRQIARVESGTSDKWNSVTVSNVTTAWKAEGRRSPTVPRPPAA